MTVETRTIVEVPAREKTPADVLRHVARIIEERGWCQVSSEDSTGRVCIIGGIETAVFGRVGDTKDPNDSLWLDHKWPLVNAVRDHLDSFLDVPSTWVYNDETGRTASEVTAALRSAADAWEAKR